MELKTIKEMYFPSYHEFLRLGASGLVNSVAHRCHQSHGSVCLSTLPISAAAWLLLWSQQDYAIPRIVRRHKQIQGRKKTILEMYSLKKRES